MALRPTLVDRIARMIERDGAIALADYMALANVHYYATRDPLGAAGDFTTAPEISQMFGELIGLWLADLAMRADVTDADYVELGPGRGTLAADALRAMASVGDRPHIHFVETSPALAAAQCARVPEARRHLAVETLPGDRPLRIVANEFFDALPVRQLVATPRGWRERMIGLDGDTFAALPGNTPMDSIVPAPLRGGPPGSIVEIAPARATVCAELCARVADQGGALVVIDYGYSGPAAGDTLQAVRAHGFADPFTDPGERDLTCHVDFSALAAEAGAAGLRVFGPTAQGEWLERLGLSARASSLARAQPARTAELALAQARLAGPEEMGTLFKVMAMVAPGWPEPEGFA